MIKCRGGSQGKGQIGYKQVVLGKFDKNSGCALAARGSLGDQQPWPGFSQLAPGQVGTG